MQIVTQTAALNDAITLLIAYSAEITTAQVNPATGHVDDADARQDIAHIGDTVAVLRSLMYALAAPAPHPDAHLAKPMTAARAAFFMDRFRREEKLLGPNERAAVDFVIAMLENKAPSVKPQENA